MKVLIAHTSDVDPRRLAAGAQAGGHECVVWNTQDDFPEQLDVSVMAVDAWIPPAQVDELCRLAGGIPAVIVAIDGDEALLALHAVHGDRHLLALPASPVVIGDSLKVAIQQHRLAELEAEAAQRARFAKLQNDVAIAHEIQQGFLPDSLPEIPGYTMAAYLKPAREVSGDFYDAFMGVYGRRIGFSVNDVCDKGVGAALFMAIFRTLYRSLARGNASMRWLPSGKLEDSGQPESPLGALLSTARRSLSTGSGALLNAVSGTNEYMLENHALAGYFSTTFFALLDPEDGSLQYVNAGHNPPVLIRADGRQVMLMPTGPAVGVIPGSRFSIGEERLEPGDCLFCYTDGVPESRNAAGEFFGDDRLRDVLRRPGGSADEILARVLKSIASHASGAEQYDDITMLVLHRT